MRLVVVENKTVHITRPITTNISFHIAFRMSKGILYIATGQNAFAEAQSSANRLKQKDIEYPVICITDQTSTDGENFDQILPIENPLHNNGDKSYNIHRSPFEKTLYLDTDVDVVDPESITEIFEMLDNFDIVGRVDTGRRFELYQPPERRIPSIDVPDSFPMINGGVLGFVNNERVTELFERWRSSFDEYKNKMDNPQSQPALREALYKSSVQFGPIPPEYNMRIPYPHFLVGDVKILHGRASNLEELGESINADTESIWHGRVYLPAHQNLVGSKWWDPGNHPVSPVFNSGRFELFTEITRLSVSQYGVVRTALYCLIGGPAKGRIRIHYLRKHIDEHGFFRTAKKIINKILP